MKAKSISFNDVSETARKHKDQILSKISSVLSSGIFLNGPQGRQLTNKLLKHFGKGFIILCASGHDALFLALEALKIGKEDEIIFPVNSYPTAFPVCLSSGVAVPCDVDENGQMDPYSLSKQISKKTKAVILVHLYGLCGRIEEIKKITKKSHIYLIEDCAQAFGLEYKNKKIGTLGDIGCFSFYPTKNLSTLGDGGAIFTRHKKIAAFLGKAVSYGEKIHYQSDFLASHSRLAEIQAGIVNCFFSKTLQELKKRRKVAQYYQEQIKKANLEGLITVFQTASQTKSAPHLFVVLAKKRDLLRDYLNKQGIPTLIHYPKPIHLVKAFSYLGYKKGDFPQAEKQAQEILSLPFHPSLSRAEVFYIVSKIKEFYDKTS